MEKTLNDLVDAREFGLVELRADAGTPGGMGFLFLSDEVQPLQKKRDAYIPAQAELNDLRRELFQRIFDPVPETKLEGVKPVPAGIRLGRAAVTAERSDILFRLEEADSATLQQKLADLEADSQKRDDQKNVVTWLFARPDDVEDRLAEICRSRFIQVEGARSRDKEKSLAADVGRYLRSEDRRAERAMDVAKEAYDKALYKGWLVFRGTKRPVEELGANLLASSTAFLADAASKVFSHFSLVKKNVPGETARKLLEAPRLDRIPREADPLRLVQTKAGRTTVNVSHPALDEALRQFQERNAAAGSGRVQGSALLEWFLAPPYGWSKDTTRYLFAALLTAGEIEIHAGDSVIRTAGPKAAQAFKNTQAFARVGVAVRGQRPPLEALDRASRRLEEMFGVEVLPLEDQISRAVRTHFPDVVARVGVLPERLRLLRLPGQERARSFLQACADVLSGDASGATSLLGGTESSLPGDKRWADALTKTLDPTTEGEIGEIRAAADRTRELARLFAPAEPLSRHESLAKIADVLSSESFHDRLVEQHPAPSGPWPALPRLRAERRRATRVYRRTRCPREPCVPWASSPPCTRSRNPRWCSSTRSRIRSTHARWRRFSKLRRRLPSASRSW